MILTNKQTVSVAPFGANRFGKPFGEGEPMKTFQTEICARRRREIFEAKDLLGWVFFEISSHWHLPNAIFLKENPLWEVFCFNIFAPAA